MRGRGDILHGRPALKNFSTASNAGPDPYRAISG
jgi:hypothetical protein